MKKVKEVNLHISCGAIGDYTKEFKDYYTDDVEKTFDDIVTQIMNKDIITVEGDNGRMIAVRVKHVAAITVDFMDVKEDEET